MHLPLKPYVILNLLFKVKTQLTVSHLDMRSTLAKWHLMRHVALCQLFPPSTRLNTQQEKLGRMQIKHENSLHKLNKEILNFKQT